MHAHKEATESNMYIERTVEFEVDIGDFDTVDILEQARSIIWVSKECDKADIERFKRDIDFHSIDWLIDSVHSMDREFFEALYKEMTNSWQNLT
jgi:hypothetical protein